MEEIEYYSNCCDAPPLTEVSYKEEYDAEPLGMCMKCQDKAIFRISKLKYIIKEKDNGNN